MRNIKLTMEYDGTRYKGWQQAGKAPNTGTISEKILDVLQLMTGETIELCCAARTETGVHALIQTASFKTNCTLPVADIQDYLNHYLPQDIVVLSTEEVPERFHAGLNNFDARIGLDFVKNLVSHLVGVQNVGHFFNHLKFYQIGVGNNQCFFETSAFDFRHNLVDGAVPVVAGFV